MVNKDQTLRKTLSLFIYVILAGAIAFLIADRHPPALHTDTIAPIDERIILINGSTTTFRKLLKRPMVINFWGSFCPPCIKELPVFSKMFQKYRDRISFLGVAVATNKEEVLNAKRAFFLDYDLALISGDAVNKWNALVLPTTYIIDTKGKILFAKSGISSEEQLEAAIQMSLGKK